MDLTGYERAKFALAESLRSLALLVRNGADAEPEWLHELFVRLAEDRFNLVVVGGFSRGKTSLMNAILGMDRLPVGIVPLTSVITSVVYGSRAQAVIRYQDGRRLPGEISLEALQEYITQQHNPGNVRGVQMAEVKLPAEILRRGFHFVDTPGLGSPIIENTRTTEAFLPEADVFLLVTSFDSPFSADELRILRKIASSARRIFFVINKQDLASRADRDATLSYIREQLSASLDSEAPRVFSVSARQALAAKLSGNAADLAASGIGSLEAELIRFLLAEKSGEFLLRLCDRIAERIRTLPRSAEADRLTKKVCSLSRRIAEAHPGATLRSESASLGNAPAGPLQQLRPCEICASIVSASFEFLRHFQYELSVRPDLQQAHAERGGLCPPHTWDYGTLAFSHGFCISYPPLLEWLAERFRDLASPARPAEAFPIGIRSLLPTEATCVLCGEQARAEREAVAAIVQKLREQPVRAVDALSTICVPHLHLLAASADDTAVMQRLMSREATILDRLAEDMRRYATKRDATRRNLASEEEAHADQRALAALAGLRNANPAARGHS